MKYPKVCDWCGVIFDMKRKEPKGRRKTCSRECAARSRRRRVLQSRPAITQQPEDYKIIVASTGARVEVSNEDYDYLRVIPWQIMSRGYVSTTDSAGKMQLMHRVIMGRLCNLKDHELVDHRDRNRTNNRRSNLRIATKSENNSNKAKRADCSSDYMGVKVAIRKRPGFIADYWVNQQNFWIGIFDDEEEAAWMRDQWATALRGDFANLNFEYK